MGAINPRSQIPKSGGKPTKHQIIVCGHDQLSHVIAHLGVHILLAMQDIETLKTVDFTEKKKISLWINADLLTFQNAERIS